MSTPGFRSACVTHGGRVGHGQREDDDDVRTSRPDVPQLCEPRDPPLDAVTQLDHRAGSGPHVTELDQLRAANAKLVAANLLLERRAARAEQAVENGCGEVDAVAVDTQQQVRESRQLLRAIFDGALDAIILVDDKGGCLDANLVACELLATSRTKLLQHSIADFLTLEPGSDAALREFLQRGSFVGVIPLQLRDGTRRTVELRAVANVMPGKHLAVLRDVSDRVEAEHALRRNEALFRAVIEKSSEIISLTARDGTTAYLTSAARSFLGFAADDPRRLRDQVVPEDRELLTAEIARLVRTGDRDTAMDLRVLHADGTIRWIETTGTNLLDDPDVGAIVAHYRDITARKTAEAELRASRDALEEAQAIARLGSWSSGIADTSIHWTNECFRIFGVAPGGPMTREVLFSRVHPDDRDRVRRVGADVLAAGQAKDLEYRIVWPDDQIRWVSVRVSPEPSPTGSPTRVRGTVQDVTERHHAIEALRASEMRYRRIVENTSEGIWMYDANDVTTFMNARMGEMIGCPVTDAVGQPIFKFIDHANHTVAKERVRNRHAGRSDHSDFSLKRADGTELRVSIQANPLFDMEGRFEGAVALLRDVTKERSADEARAHLAAIVESSDDAILGIDLHDTITSWNQGAVQLYQYRADEMVGQPIALLAPPAMVSAEERYVRAFVHERGGTFTCERRRKDGSPVEVAVTLSPVRDTAGNLIGISSIARDRSALRRAEAELRGAEDQLRQAQKMEAVGRLAGGIAHDFNNLLSVILSYSEFAIEDLKPGDPLRDDMIQIDQAGKQAASLTRQLLAFSRQQVLQPRVVNLTEIIRPMEGMLRRLLGEDIELVVLATPAVGQVMADPGQIEQVVMNLAVNARDAMREAGTLTIETSDLSVDAERGKTGVVPPGDYVVLSVRDTGIGMDAATRARIFEPFFTTKELGKGTGLGLSTVFGIVHQSSGYVDVSTAVGRGTTFTVYLPRTDQVPYVATVHSDAPVERGSETILLVEDEEQVRIVACSILRRNGYIVLDASNAGEAFLVSRAHAEQIDLLLTDVVMPRMSGRQLAEELVVWRPAMKVLYASGYTDTVIEHGVLDADTAFIQKPFTPEVLLRKVREVLDRQAS